jgi:hypothetical protein
MFSGSNPLHPLVLVVQESSRHLNADLNKD